MSVIFYVVFFVKSEAKSKLCVEKNCNKKKLNLPSKKK